MTNAAFLLSATPFLPFVSTLSLTLIHFAATQTILKSAVLHISCCCYFPYAGLTSRFLRPRSSAHTTAGSLVQPIVFFHQSESRLPAKLISKYPDGQTIRTSDPAVCWNEDVNRTPKAAGIESIFSQITPKRTGYRQLNFSYVETHFLTATSLKFSACYLTKRSFVHVQLLLKISKHTKEI